MSHQVVWMRVADEDVEQIVHYIKHKVSPEQALKSFDLIMDGANSLHMLPHRGRIVSELPKVGVTIYRELFVKPYRIIYRLNHDDRVLIFAVIDYRRNVADLLTERALRV